jgi:hypothetical protein
VYVLSLSSHHKSFKTEEKKRKPTLYLRRMGGKETVRRKYELQKYWISWLPKPPIWYKWRAGFRAGIVKDSPGNHRTPPEFVVIQA